MCETCSALAITKKDQTSHPFSVTSTESVQHERTYVRPIEVTAYAAAQNPLRCYVRENEVLPVSHEAPLAPTYTSYEREVNLLFGFCFHVSLACRVCSVYSFLFIFPSFLLSCFCLYRVFFRLIFPSVHLEHVPLSAPAGFLGIQSIRDDDPNQPTNQLNQHTPFPASQTQENTDSRTHPKNRPSPVPRGVQRKPARPAVQIQHLKSRSQFSHKRPRFSSPRGERLLLVCRRCRRHHGCRLYRGRHVDTSGISRCHCLAGGRGARRRSPSSWRDCGIRYAQLREGLRADDALVRRGPGGAAGARAIGPACRGCECAIQPRLEGVVGVAADATEMNVGRGKSFLFHSLCEMAGARGK